MHAESASVLPSSTLGVGQILRASKNVSLKNKCFWKNETDKGRFPGKLRGQPAPFLDAWDLVVQPAGGQCVSVLLAFQTSSRPSGAMQRIVLVSHALASVQQASRGPQRPLRRPVLALKAAARCSGAAPVATAEPSAWPTGAGTSATAGAAGEGGSAPDAANNAANNAVRWLLKSAEDSFVNDLAWQVPHTRMRRRPIPRTLLSGRELGFWCRAAPRSCRPAIASMNRAVTRKQRSLDHLRAL